MEAVAKFCQHGILESGRKPTNRDLKVVFWGLYDKHLRKYGTFNRNRRLLNRNCLTCPSV